jgi:membrane protease YdiL (CAAX protease family)
MPLLVAVALLYRHGDPAARRDYWMRVIDLRRLGLVWGGVSLFLPPLLVLCGVLLDRALGGDGAQPEAIARYAGRPLALIGYAAFLLPFGPLPEELAWRGYALDRLQARWQPFASSLILGALWTAWHLPLFAIASSYQHSLGVGSARFWLFMLDKVPLAVLMTWIYNATRRSTLSAVLFHYAVNLTGELFALTTRAEILHVVLLYLAAGIVSSRWLAMRRSGHTAVDMRPASHTHRSE